MNTAEQQVTTISLPRGVNVGLNMNQALKNILADDGLGHIICCSKFCISSLLDDFE
jgi:hypothetical protein